MNYFKEYETLKEVRKLIPMQSEWICVEHTGVISVGETFYIHSHRDYNKVTVVNFSTHVYGYACFSRTKDDFLRCFRPSNS